MASLRQRLLETTLWAIAIIAGHMLLHGAVGAGCVNNQCKPIDFFYRCDTEKFWAYDEPDCRACWALGRCLDPNNVDCVPQQDNVWKAEADGDEICGCISVPSSDYTVEATADITGEMKDAGVPRGQCAMGS